MHECAVSDRVGWALLIGEVTQVIITGRVCQGILACPVVLRHEILDVLAHHGLDVGLRLPPRHVSRRRRDSVILEEAGQVIRLSIAADRPLGDDRLEGSLVGQDVRVKHCLTRLEKAVALR